MSTTYSSISVADSTNKEVQSLITNGTLGTVWTSNGPNAPASWQSGAGTVTSVSVATANGFSGTVANASTTPAITLTTSQTGLLSGNGTAITGTAITQYNVLTAGASNAPNSVAPSATSGVPLISQGSSAQPIFGTAVVAGGGTGITSSTAYGLITGGTTTTGAFQTVTPGTAHTVVTSGGTAALHTYTSAFKITSDVMTNTAQPAFNYYLGTSDTNAIGGNAYYYLGSGNALTQLFDNGSNCSTAGVFTAPVTGIYLLGGTITINPAAANTTQLSMSILANSVGYTGTTVVGTSLESTYSSISFSVLVKLSATQTAKLGVYANGSATGTAYAGQGNSYFWGQLVC